MRVLFWGVYDTGKPRTRILREGLKKAGVEVLEIHAPIWEGIEDKSQVRGLLPKLRIAMRWLLAYPGLAWRLVHAPRTDFILIGYPGLIDAFVASSIARLHRTPVVWDVFLSIYDTVCEDRRLAAPNSPAGRLLHWLEARALRCVDLIFMDTQAHARRIEALFHLDEGRCDAVWVGVEDQHFTSSAPVISAPRPSMRVLFYGQFIPLHGVETIIEAARLLRHEPIEWQFVGQGQEADRIRTLLSDDPLPQVQWTDWVEYEQLHRWLTQADLCLGIFGTSEKAASVIPNKVFQIVAAGRPLVTRDSAAIRELLSPTAACTYLVPAGDAAELAAVIVAHFHHLQEAPAACHAGLAARFTPAAIGQQFVDMIKRRMIQ